MTSPDDLPAVVLVHGFATSCARTWGETGWLDLLADTGRHVIGIDLLGHGEAPKPHDPEAYDHMEDLVLEAFPAEPVDAIGFSLGARTLLALASAHPDRFHRLVVAGVGANLFRQDESGQVIADAISGTTGQGAEINPVAQYFRSLAEQPGNDAVALEACMRRPRATPISAEGLGRIACPVLVVLGDRDFAGPADPLLEALPDATLVTLRNVDHFATPKDFGFIDAGLEFIGAAPVSDFVLGVDIDGVCGDHALAFRDVVAAERGIDPETLPPQQTWNFHEWGLTDEDFDELHRRAILEHRMFATMPPIDGVAETLWRLSDAGVWIRLITHRLYANFGHAVAVADTVTWLDQVGIPYRDLCFLGRKPEVQADAYVDDVPHNIAELRRAGNPVIVFDQPYNRELDGLRASSWVDVEELVTELRLDRGDAVQGRLPVVEGGTDRLSQRVGRPEAR